MLCAIGLVVALVAALVTWQLVRRDPRRPVPAANRPGPVLLVPGFGGNTGSLAPLAARLRAAGRQATVVPLPDGGTGDLNRQAAALDGFVRSALSAGAGSVDVVGYSAGGVVARLWAQTHDGTHKARRIITLGAPHHGTDLAAAGTALVPGECPVACQQLAPGSRLLAGLRVPVPTPPAWLALWTTDDQTVTPPDSARLEGATDLPVQSICPGLRLSHTQLPSDRFVEDAVLDALGAGPIHLPTTADCG